MRQAAVLCVFVQALVDFADVYEIFYLSLLAGWQPETLKHALGVVCEGVPDDLFLLEALAEHLGYLLAARLEAVEDVDLIASGDLNDGSLAHFLELSLADDRLGVYTK